MTCDICPYCDGTGKRDPVSGAKCWECNGTGIVFDDDYYDDDFDVTIINDDQGEF